MGYLWAIVFGQGSCLSSSSRPRRILSSDTKYDAKSHGFTPKGTRPDLGQKIKGKNERVYDARPPGLTPRLSISFGIRAKVSPWP